MADYVTPIGARPRITRAARRARADLPRRGRQDRRARRRCVRAVDPRDRRLRQPRQRRRPTTTSRASAGATRASTASTSPTRRPACARSCSCCASTSIRSSPIRRYKDQILLPGTLKLGFRGKVQTWWDLWGTWATGALYGQRVYDIYERMRVLRRHRSGAAGEEARHARRRRARPTRDASRRQRRGHEEAVASSCATVHPEANRAAGGCRCACCCASTRPGPSSSIVPTRASSSSSTTRISRRARLAPRQWCTPWPNPRCGFGSRRDVEAERVGEHALVAVRRRLPEHHLVARARSSSPAELDGRGSRCGGCTRRDGSSARSPRPRSASTVGRRADARAGRGTSMNATIAPAIALRVVSAPAAHSRREEELQLLVGELRRVLAVEQRRVAHDREHVVGGMRALLGDERARRTRTSRAAACRDVVGRLERLAVALEVEAVLDPLEQLVAIGLGDAHQDADRLHRQLARDRRSRSRTRRGRARRRRAAPARRRRSPSRRVIVRGVRPLLTSSRTRWWRGSSIMLSIRPGDRQVGERRAAVGAVAAGLRRERAGSWIDRHALGVRVHRPEALAVGRVRGRLVPQHGRRRAQTA